MADVQEITPIELQRQLQSTAPPLLLDVREPWETAICRIDGSTLIPLRSLPHRLEELTRDRAVAVICHAGSRSYAAAQFLLQHGYDAASVRGGIDAWAVVVDRAMKRY